MNKHHVNHVLIEESAIQRRIDELVRDMAAVCKSDNFVMIGILRGSFLFFADLVRDLYHHDVHPRIDFLMLESYGTGTESSGQVRVAKDIGVDINGADVLLVDDILDTGRTLSFAKELMLKKGAGSVRTCVLLDKPSRRLIQTTADYTGFKIENEFVVGYGLDYDGRYRELPNISKVTFYED